MQQGFWYQDIKNAIVFNQAVANIIKMYKRGEFQVWDFGPNGFYYINILLLCIYYNLNINIF
jgi:hypothetical protein